MLALIIVVSGCEPAGSTEISDLETRTHSFRARFDGNGHPGGDDRRLA